MVILMMVIPETYLNCYSRNVHDDGFSRNVHGWLSRNVHVMVIPETYLVMVIPETYDDGYSRNVPEIPVPTDGYVPNDGYSRNVFQKRT